MATARTMDPPPLRNKGHGPRGNDLEVQSQEQPMIMGANKAFEDIGTKGCLILNADVGIGKMGNRT